MDDKKETDSKFFDHSFIRKVADSSPGMIAVYNIKTGEYLYVNSAIRKILGYEPEEFTRGGYNFVISLLHPDDLPSIGEKNGEALRKANSEAIPDNESIVNFEYRMRHKDGSYRWLHSDGSVFSRDANGQVDCVLNISVDITKRKETEGRMEVEMEENKRELSRTAAYLSAIVNFTSDAVIGKSLEGMITSWNLAAEKMYGYTAEEAIGKHVNLIVPPELPEQFLMIVEKIKQDIPIESFESTRITKSGERIQVSVTASPIKNWKGEVIGVSAISRDITEQKLAEEKIRHHYYHDPLTKLPNRTWFNEQINILAMENRPFAMLLIDLDRFKFINESLGHPTGDKLIQEAGLRIQSCLDENSDLARFGGDEFAIICKECNETEVASLAQDLLEDFRNFFILESQEIYITPSMGISFFPRDGRSASDLVQAAEIALYHAKEEGKNNYQIYNENMSIMAGYDVNLENQLRRAIEKQQLVIYYQPQVSLTSGEILKSEALVRIQDKKLHLTMPDKFIPLAEATGLIEPLSEIVLRKACEQNKIWNDSGYPELKIAVNISSRQFKQPHFTKVVERIIKETGINPRNLDFEITERVLLEGSTTLLKSMRTLAKWGINFSLDDFSMGFSSLNYIQKFPLNVLKIDRTFVIGIPKNKTNCAIAKSIITLAHNLGMRVVAEGVETLEQLHFLYDNGCDKVQGYIFNGPIPAESVTEILGNSRYVNTINKIRNPTLPFQFA
ncbi:MAG: EAL domain-containing protein [Candidatus Doudnabacteria bacterium]|nr:EAL domain-containing protein [Candidatus Doudnabacteria bacterium]